MEYDILSESKIVSMFPGVGIVGGSVAGAATDTAGFRSTVAVIGVDNFGGTANLFLEHSEDNVTWSRIPADELQGRGVAFAAPGHIALTAAGTGFNCRVGILSKSRYLRCYQEELTATSSFGAMHFVLMDAVHRPTNHQTAP